MLTQNFENFHFGYTDYSIFILMLFSSLAIGLYFSRKKEETQESSEVNYLVGNRALSMIPVGISLVASNISGGGVVGFTTELYLYGYHYSFIVLSFIPVNILAHYFFLPVFHEMKLISVYEYFEKRFDQKLSWMCSVLSLINAVSQTQI